MIKARLVNDAKRSDEVAEALRCLVSSLLTTRPKIFDQHDARIIDLCSRFVGHNRSQTDERFLARFKNMNRFKRVPSVLIVILILSMHTIRFDSDTLKATLRCL